VPADVVCHVAFPSVTAVQNTAKTGQQRTTVSFRKEKREEKRKEGNSLRVEASAEGPVEKSIPKEFPE